MASISKETDGKYISGRNDSDIQPENSSAAAHIRKPISTKGKDGKTSSAHFSNSEPPVYTDNTTNVQYAKAAELKKNLEREVTLGQSDNKTTISNDAETLFQKKEKTDNPFNENKNDERKAANKYFSYEKAKNENQYRKRVYKIEKKYKILYSQEPSVKNRFTLLRKLSILNQNIISPIKKGNPIGVVTAPTAIFIKRKLEKYRLGRMATRTQEAGKRIISAADNTADTSQTLSSVTQKAATEVVKGTVGTVNRYLDIKKQKKRQENKYLKEAAREEAAQYITNMRYINKRDAIIANENDFNSRKASDKLAKKIENFNKKDNQKQKAQKLEEKNKKLEKKILKKQRPYNDTLKKNIKKKSKAKLLGMVAASGISSVIPIVLIVLIIAIVASFVFYPFFYLSVTEETTDDEGNVINTENKIEDSEIPDTISHYYGIMNGVVDEINSEIDAIFAGGDKYNNTGVIDPVKKAQYDVDYQYFLDHAFDSPPPPIPNENSIYYSDAELCEMGAERGPIFEGFRWSPDTDAARVPYGKLYDEILCTIAAYNAKIMNQAGNNDIIFMDDQSVEAAYAGAHFWELSTWSESVSCGSGGKCCKKRVPDGAVYDDKGNAVGTKFKIVTYCPGHFVIMVKLKLNFNLDEVWNSYAFDDSDKKIFDEILKQLKKDK